MSNKPATKPAKPSVTAVRVRTIMAVGIAATSLTGFAAWGALFDQWPKVAFDLVLASTILTWVAAIALAHAHHIQKYVRAIALTDHYNCVRREKVVIARFDRLERLILSSSVAAEAERVLRAGEN
ncbi:hypothetical protein [Prauserella endophytica]|uniref:Uncharacterized protein n=1 Tax=Prauserella endophytica TaxID=1592324 RepID=A0ABY2S064_9PSEU|nr:hypothetical protein [Prauserella endophytica]TKG67015.1 hypothetical protein FCN18_24220 [Prauserella endophytica]